jgi:RNA polymerase sigma-70 factor (ECF subfamily)
VESVTVAGRPRAEAISETSLIRAAQEHDHDAFEQLVRLYDRSVLRVALNILRSEDEARDAYQEVFLRTYRNLRGFRFQCSFHTWLYRIATNVCLDFLRRKGARKEQILGDDGEHSGTTVFERAADGSPASNPDRVLTQTEMGREIADALGTLTPKERVVFELKHYEGLRLRAIGEMLSISEEAAKNSLFRATRKLRTALKDVPR